MSSGPAQTQIAIQFTHISEDALSGVDGFGRPWEWKKLERSSGAVRAGSETMDPQRQQELLGKMLTELAQKRFEALKEVAKKLRDEDSGEGQASGKTRNKKK
jgi:hypothetical protein